MAGIYEAIINIMGEVGAISKDKKTSGFGESFSYRGIDDVYNVLNPLMAKHGVFCCPEVLDTTREERVNRKGTVMAFVTAKVRYTFFAKDGSSVSCVTCGEGMDSGDKATSKALSIAMKYAMFQIFVIPTEEMPDPDATIDQLAPRGTVSKQKHEADRAHAKANNPTPPSEKQFAAFWAIMKKRHPEAKTKEQLVSIAYEEAGRFVRREIKSVYDMTKDEVSNFLNACNSPADVPDNPF